MRQLSRVSPLQQRRAAFFRLRSRFNLTFVLFHAFVRYNTEQPFFCLHSRVSPRQQLFLPFAGIVLMFGQGSFVEPLTSDFESWVSLRWSSPGCSARWWIDRFASFLSAQSFIRILFFCAASSVGPLFCASILADHACAQAAFSDLMYRIVFVLADHACAQRCIA